MNLPDMNKARSRNKEKVQYFYETPMVNNSFNGQKYYIRTYGCQMNVHDSEEIAGLLENLGLEKTDEEAKADLIILNTCAIRENAHDKVFGFLGRCKHLKKENPKLKIILCGCMAQEPSVVAEIQKNYQFIDLVFGTHNIHEIPNYLMHLNKGLNIEVKSNEGNVFEIGENFHRDSQYTAWINIMYGCDKFCTYCIVPYTRGKERSRKCEDILREVTHLQELGYQEVTLLGQNVNAYGNDLEEPIPFGQLLARVAETGIPRIRFVTSHPWNFTDEMIQTIAKYPNIMPYIHLPLQSGSDRILRLMGRRYTKDEYLALVEKIRKTIPNVSITTDIIVGFPSETEEDFQATLDVVNACQYDGAYTFIYSKREGTPAAKMADDTPLEVKEERLHRLNEIVNNYSLMNNQKYLNKTVDVLLLGTSEKDHNKLYGYTDTMKLVNVECDKNEVGKIVPVLITEAKSFSLDGKVEK